MPVGVVRWFDKKKGFGFVMDVNGVDVFVHYTVIRGEGFRYLRDGERVEYETVKGPRGLCAQWVRQLDPPPGADGAEGVEDESPDDLP